MHRVENKHTNVRMSLFKIPHNIKFLQLILLLNASYKLDVKCVDTETINASGV